MFSPQTVDLREVAVSEMEAYYRQSRSSPGDFYSQLMALKAEQEEHIALVEGVYLRELAGSRAGEAAGKRGILKGTEGHNKQVKMVLFVGLSRLHGPVTGRHLEYSLLLVAYRSAFVKQNISHRPDLVSIYQGSFF